MRLKQIGDPFQSGRQIGPVTAPSNDDYAQLVLRIAVRCRKHNGQWAVAVLVTNLSPAEVAALVEIDPDILADPSELWLAYVLCYVCVALQMLFF